jgi:Flp pilus assembly protein TadD
MKSKEPRPVAKQGDADALCALASLLVSEGQLEQATTTYREALALRPNLQHAHNQLANVLRQLGQLDEAGAHYIEAIALAPQNSSLYYNLANVIAERGSLTAAAKLYRQAIALTPDYSDAHNGLGVTLSTLGQLDEAIVHFRHALESNAGNVLARINLGLALVDQGRLVEAREQAAIMSSASAEPSFPHHLAAVLLARCGATDAARVCFHAHLQRDPEDRLGIKLLLAALGGIAIPRWGTARGAATTASRSERARTSPPGRRALHDG